MLHFQQLSVNFSLPGGETLPALGPISGVINKHEFVCIVGSSGCGKSTLINVVAGLQKPTSGQAMIGNEVIRGPSPRVGLMFQSANLMPWRTVRDNVALPLELAGLGRSARFPKVDDMLDTLGLAEFAETYPGGLSGGMAQRVALGRVLVQNPEVLLLDEPFGALDALTREQVSMDLLAAWRMARQTVLMVTHDLAEAVLLADRVWVMSRRPGRISADIPVPLPRPRTPETIFTPEFAEIARHVRESLMTA